ncbi:hypothetical protein APHAL10511_003293 [Amanita phalloides]|nr:hypothetical protein APHAL10511_003293 [Amanita phalloides]
MSKPQTDLRDVLDTEIKEWHFHIYFHHNNAQEHQAALELRDAVLQLRRDGAFVAVPFHTVHTEAFGPHPTGSFEIWAPAESFASVFSYLSKNKGQLSILVHPLTREILEDHVDHHAWIGPSYPLNLSVLPPRVEEVPLQYPSLKLGYSSTVPKMSLEERLKSGDNIEALVKGEKGAAEAPPRTA